MFKQPAGKPSKITAFVCTLRLGQILAFAMRTIVSTSAYIYRHETHVLSQYSTNKSRGQPGQSDQQWEQGVVADLDSALNKWSDSLPSHREPPRVFPLPPSVLSLEWGALQYAGIPKRRTCSSSPRRRVSALCITTSNVPSTDRSCRAPDAGRPCRFRPSSCARTAPGHLSRCSRSCTSGRVVLAPGTW